MASEPATDVRVGWDFINKQHPMPSFVLPSSHAALREIVPKEQIAALCTKFSDDKVHHQTQHFREAIMVPVFTYEAVNKCDEPRMRAHIEKGRKHIKPAGEILEAMLFDGHNDPADSARGPAFRTKQTGAAYPRKPITGKVGRLSGTMANPDSVRTFAGRPSTSFRRCVADSSSPVLDAGRAPSRCDADRPASRCDIGQGDPPRAQSRCEVERPRSSCEAIRSDPERSAEQSDSSQTASKGSNPLISARESRMPAPEQVKQQSRGAAAAVASSNDADEALASGASALAIGKIGSLAKDPMGQIAAKKAAPTSGQVLKRSGKNVYVAPFVPFAKSNRTRPLRGTAFREERAKSYAPSLPLWPRKARGGDCPSGFSNF